MGMFVNGMVGWLQPLHVHDEDLLPGEGAELEVPVSSLFSIVPVVGPRVAGSHVQISLLKGAQGLGA